MNSSADSIRIFMLENAGLSFGAPEESRMLRTNSAAAAAEPVSSGRTRRGGRLSILAHTLKWFIMRRYELMQMNK